MWLPPLIWNYSELQIRGGIHIIFSLFLDVNICCGYSLEAPHWGASNEYPQHMFLLRNKKDISSFLMKKVPYLLLWLFSLKIVIGPCQAKKNLQIQIICACAKYQMGICSPLILSFVSSDSVSGQQNPDQMARMCRLISAFAVCLWLKTNFRMVRPNIWTVLVQPCKLHSCHVKNIS